MRNCTYVPLCRPTLVLLTNGSVQTRTTAFLVYDVYDGYDTRSEIENGLNREAQQA